MSSDLRFLTGYIVILVKKVVNFICVQVETIAVCSFDNSRIRGCFMSRGEHCGSVAAEDIPVDNVLLNVSKEGGPLSDTSFTLRLSHECVCVPVKPGLRLVI